MVEPLEDAEDPVLLTLGNTDPVVFHPDSHALLPLIASDDNFGGTLLGHELGRVGHQVGQDLCEDGLLGHDRGKVSVYGDLRFDLLQRRSHLLHDGADDLLQVDGLKLQGFEAQAAVVQEVGDQVLGPGARHDDPLGEVLRVSVRALAQVVHKSVGEAGHGAEGCAQIVGDRVREGFELVVGLLQLSGEGSELRLTLSDRLGRAHPLHEPRNGVRQAGRQTHDPPIRLHDLSVGQRQGADRVAADHHGKSHVRLHAEVVKDVRRMTLLGTGIPLHHRLTLLNGDSGQGLVRGDHEWFPILRQREPLGGGEDHDVPLRVVALDGDDGEAGDPAHLLENVVQGLAEAFGR